MDSTLSKTPVALKILMFNNCKQDSGQIFAGFSENHYRILGENAAFLDYAIGKYRGNVTRSIIDRSGGISRTGTGLVM